MQYVNENENENVNVKGRRCEGRRKQCKQVTHPPSFQLPREHPSHIYQRALVAHIARIQPHDAPPSRICWGRCGARGRQEGARRRGLSWLHWWDAQPPTDPTDGCSCLLPYLWWTWWWNGWTARVRARAHPLSLPWAMLPCWPRPPLPSQRRPAAALGVPEWPIRGSWREKGRARMSDWATCVIERWFILSSLKKNMQRLTSFLIWMLADFSFLTMYTV